MIELVVAAVILTALAAAIEIWLAFPISASVYAVAALVWLAALALGSILTGFTARRRIAAVTFVLALAILYLVPWTSRKPFLRDLHRVEVGMTEAEVDEIMGRYTRGSGWPACPKGVKARDGVTRHHPSCPLGVDATSFVAAREPRREKLKTRIYRHSTEARFNSDWGMVRFREGRVARVEFLPD